MNPPSHQVLITLDSCRWDAFTEADIPFIKSGIHAQCWSHGTYTLPAHHAFFAGKLPHRFGGEKYFDTAAAARRKTQPQIWRLANLESVQPSMMKLEGRSIKAGFKMQGYETIGTGAMSWFNPDKPATEFLLADFDHFRFFYNEESGDGRNVEDQVDWLLERAKEAEKPLFVFLNVGETHHRYSAKGHGLTGEWGDAAGCRAAQIASLEYVDGHIKRLLDGLGTYAAVICGDHGDCWGEDGLWGHCFHHPKVMEVPMAVLRTDQGMLGGLWDSLKR